MFVVHKLEQGQGNWAKGDIAGPPFWGMGWVTFGHNLERKGLTAIRRLI